MLDRREALRRSKDIPGFQEHPNGDGYSFKMLKGGQRVSVTGAGITDEVFQHAALGQINVTKANKAIAALVPRPEPQMLPIDDALKAHIARRDISRKVVIAMTRKRRDEPILILWHGEAMHVIDGHHRLARLIRNKVSHVACYILPPEALPSLKVRWHAEDPSTGIMREIPDEDIAKRLLAGL